MNGNLVSWLTAAADLDEGERRDYYVRLITNLSFEVSRETMQEAVQKSLPRRRTLAQASGVHN